MAASARLLLAVPGSDDDALRRALAKLEGALGAREAVGLDVDAPADLPLSGPPPRPAGASSSSTSRPRATS